MFNIFRIIICIIFNTSIQLKSLFTKVDFKSVLETGLIVKIIYYYLLFYG